MEPWSESQGAKPPEAAIILALGYEWQICFRPNLPSPPATKHIPNPARRPGKHKLPQSGPGGVLAAKAFLAYFEPRKHVWRNDFYSFCPTKIMSI